MIWTCKDDIDCQSPLVWLVSFFCGATRRTESIKKKSEKKTIHNLKHLIRKTISGINAEIRRDEFEMTRNRSCYISNSREDI